MSTTPLGGGPSPAPTPAPAADRLSSREVQVLSLISWGYSNKEIAARLRMSVKTIETYKTRGLKKLGVSGRAGVVRYAVRHGWLVEGSEFDPVAGGGPCRGLEPDADDPFVRRA